MFQGVEGGNACSVAIARPGPVLVAVIRALVRSPG